MAWTNGGSGSKIPAAVKREVRERQHDQCNTIDPNACTGVIDEFDHIVNVKTLGIERADANDPDNIQGLCTPCHKVKTQGESRVATAARTARGRHPVEPHPGLIG